MLTQIIDYLHAMEEPATAPWGLRISDADLEKLEAGFEPQDQDDKWRVSATYQPISIHITRFATGKEFYILHVVVKPGDDDSSSSSVEIEAITWEQNLGEIHISEEQAKKEVLMITIGLLECDFDALSEDYINNLWNHPATHVKATNVSFLP